MCRDPDVILCTLIHTIVSAVGLHYAACDEHMGCPGMHLSGAPRWVLSELHSDVDDTSSTIK